ncbi:MAG: hypothetical protein VXA26_10725, partial [Candidatus Neomarinimicrobiota bacterium]
DPDYGGYNLSASTSLTDIVKLVASSGAFAALKSDGTVVTWGSSDYGGSSSFGYVGTTTTDTGTTVQVALIENIVDIVSNDRAFAALTASGGVLTWGDISLGGFPAKIYSDYTDTVESIENVNSIYSNGIHSFAAVKNDGSIYTWGTMPAQFNDPTASDMGVSSGDEIQEVIGNATGWTALFTDGSTYHFGGYGSNPTDTGNSSSFTNIIKVYKNHYAWTALDSSGNIYTWGYNWNGGDHDDAGNFYGSSQLASELAGNVTDVIPGSTSFAAILSDGTARAWGSVYG